MRVGYTCHDDRQITDTLRTDLRARSSPVFNADTATFSGGALTRVVRFFTRRTGTLTVTGGGVTRRGNLTVDGFANVGYAFGITRPTPSISRSAPPASLPATPSPRNITPPSPATWIATTSPASPSSAASSPTSRTTDTTIAGARAEFTDTTVAGTQAQNGPGNIFLGLGCLAQSRRYTDVLPGVNLRYEATKNLVLRAAWTNTLARLHCNALSPGVGGRRRYNRPSCCAPIGFKGSGGRPNKIGVAKSGDCVGPLGPGKVSRAPGSASPAPPR